MNFKKNLDGKRRESRGFDRGQAVKHYVLEKERSLHYSIRLVAVSIYKMGNVLDFFRKLLI